MHSLCAEYPSKLLRHLSGQLVRVRVGSRRSRGAIRVLHCEQLRSAVVTVVYSSVAGLAVHSRDDAAAGAAVGWRQADILGAGVAVRARRASKAGVYRAQNDVEVGGDGVERAEERLGPEGNDG